MHLELQNNNAAAALLDEVLDTTLEDHAIFIDGLADPADSEHIAAAFEPILLANLDNLLQNITNYRLRLSLVAKAHYRYGYQPIGLRSADKAFLQPAPSLAVNIWLPGHEYAF